MKRSTIFSNKLHNRYWWHKVKGNEFVPLIYDFLNEEEWCVLSDWFTQTELEYASTGEAGIPPLSFIMGLVSGNAIDRIVQCGHYVGYSTLILGFLLRKMGKIHSLYSIDIDQNVTEFTQSWLDKAMLNDYVTLKIADSSHAAEPSEAARYLNGSPQLVFIDSSHQYEHTLAELDLWYPEICPGGFIILHDSSKFAKNFDRNNGRGVINAIIDWTTKNKVNYLNINGFVDGGSPGDYPYLDGCGLAIIQKLP